MAKSSKTSLSQKERDELGINVDNPQTIPENVSPVIKAQLLEEYKKNNGIVGAQDQPSAIETGNQLARARAAEDGDKTMQKVLETEQANADKQAQNTATSTPVADTQTSTRENTGEQKPTSGAKRQGDLNKQ